MVKLSLSITGNTMSKCRIIFANNLNLVHTINWYNTQLQTPFKRITSDLKLYLISKNTLCCLLQINLLKFKKDPYQQLSRFPLGKDPPSSLTHCRWPTCLPLLHVPETHSMENKWLWVGLHHYLLLLATSWPRYRKVLPTGLFFHSLHP